MRRLAHGDAPGPRGTPGPPGRPCELSERHHVDAPDPSTGCRRARPLGPARPPGVQRLPADRHHQIDFGPFTVTAAPKPAGAISRGYAPRRTVLDKLLVDAAVESGAELRERFTVSEVLIEDGTVTGIRGHAKDGAPVTERARLVVGADGLHSSVARAVQAATYHEQPTLEAS